jgi:hypothetical protein
MNQLWLVKHPEVTLEVKNHYNLSKPQWYLNSFLFSVKLHEQLCEKRYLLKIIICNSSKYMVKGRDDIRTEHVHMYVRLCKS